jgi:serine protease Do
MGRTGMEKNDRDDNNRKKKKSTLKNIITVILCTIFAFAYAIGGYFIVSIVMNGSIAVPAWFSNVEVYVGDSDDPIEKSEIISDNNTNIENNNDNNNNDNSEATIIREPQTDEGESEEASNDSYDVEVGHVNTVDDTEDVPLTYVTDVTAVVKAAMPCVVAITNEYTSYDSWYGEVIDDEASASGIIIDQNDDELLIVTNYHVVEDNNSLIIQFIDDSEAEGYVKGASPDDDLAIVSVSLDDLSDETIDAVAIAALGDSDKLQVGEPAIAIGNSLGYGQSVTTGVISALNRNINESYLIQTDAAINPGNSGGALLNIKGEVIGINSSKIADYVIEGMGYAIPITTAKPIIDELVLKETRLKVKESERGFLGISGTDVTEDAMNRYGMPEGVFVSSVLDGSAAEKAGIIKGDIIISLDDEKVTLMTELQGILEYYEVGTKVKVVVMRQNNGEYVEKTINVTLGRREE